MDRFDDVLELLRIYDEADVHGQLWWRVHGDSVSFAVNCSDTFAWGTADAEDVTAADLALLRRCLDDLCPFGEEYLLGELYAARKRGMRPMRLWLDSPSIVSTGGARDLFLAAGPERDE